MPVCIKKAQTHHLDLRFLPLDGTIIFAFLYFVKGEFSSSCFLCLSSNFPLYPLPPVNRQPVIQFSCNDASDFPNQRIFFHFLPKATVMYCLIVFCPASAFYDRLPLFQCKKPVPEKPFQLQQPHSVTYSFLCSSAVFRHKRLQRLIAFIADRMLHLTGI